MGKKYTVLVAALVAGGLFAGCDATSEYEIPLEEPAPYVRFAGSAPALQTERTLADTLDVPVRLAYEGGDVTVTYSVAGTAEQGVDYEIVGLAGSTGTLEFPDETNERAIQVVPLDGQLTTEPQALTITLVSAQSADGQAISIGRLPASEDPDDVFFARTRTVTILPSKASVSAVASTEAAPTSIRGGDTVVDSVAAGQTSEIAFELRNDAAAETAALSGFTVRGDSARLYTLLDAPSSLAPGATGTVRLRFSPTNVGVAPADLIFETSNALSTSLDSLRLAAFGEGGRLDAPATLAFGNVAAGPTASVSKTLTLSNTGNEPLTVTGFTVDGADAALFEVVAPNSFVLGIGAPRDIEVVYRPAAPGSARARVVFTTSGTPTQPSVSVALTGAGT